MSATIVPQSDGVPHDMRHLMNQSSVPINRNDYMPVSFLINQPTNHVASTLVPSPSSSLTNLSNHDTELEYDTRRNPDAVTSDEDMVVEPPSDSEYNASLHDSSFMSVNEEFSNTDIDPSVDMEPVVPDSPPTLDSMERLIAMEGPRRGELLQAESSIKTSKGIRKTVVNIFSQTKHCAVEVLKNTKRVLDDSDGSRDDSEKSKSHEKRPRKTPKYTSTITD